MPKNPEPVMSEPEEDSPRVRRLRLIADAIDSYLPPEWVFVLIVGKPGDDDTVNLVSNAPGEMADALVKVMVMTAGKRKRQPL
jgi:hypothetical protein